MNISQFLTAIAVVCLVAAALRAKRYLLVNQGLRRAFGGLFASAIGGVAITFSTSALAVWSFALLMLAGVGFMVWSIHVEQKSRQASSV